MLERRAKYRENMAEHDVTAVTKSIIIQPGEGNERWLESRKEANNHQDERTIMRNDKLFYNSRGGRDRQ